MSNLSTNNTSGSVSAKVDEQAATLPSLGTKKMSY